jgi:CRP-like cAMP-binding protein
MTEEDSGLRERLTKQGEETIAKLATDLLENPLVNGAISRAFEAREKAAQAQEAALGALNIPTAADIERLTRRVRSVSQRLEGIEDAIDRLDERLASNGLAGVEAKLDALAEQLAGIEEALPKPKAGRRS